MSNTAFVFSGQGSQYAGMGSEILKRCPFALQYFEEAGDILGMDLLSLCCDGSEEELRDTTVSQPAILTVSYLRYLGYCQEHQPDPIFYAGHSLGEYSALLAAGVLAFPDAIRLIGIRAACMKRCATAHRGTMLAVVCEEGYPQILPILRRSRTAGRDSAVIGCINSSRQLVLSGSTERIHRLAEELNAAGGTRAVPLQVEGAFHSPMMADAAEELREALERTTFHPLPVQCGILSNVTGVPYVDTQEVKRELILQLTHPVQWLKSVRYMTDHGADTYIEFGAKPTLSQLIRKEVPVRVFPYH